MTPDHHRHPATPGRVDTAALLYGALGFAVAGVLKWVGMLEKGDQKIFGLLHKPVFHEVVPNILGVPTLFVLTLIFCFGLAFAVLDSSGTWRRVILGFTLLVLVAAMVPALAVWEIYFPPMMCLVGVFWTWFSSMIYANHHQMPCDVSGPKVQVSDAKPDVVSHPVAVDKIVEESQEEKVKTRKPSGDTDKYKPKG